LGSSCPAGGLGVAIPGFAHMKMDCSPCKTGLGVHGFATLHSLPHRDAPPNTISQTRRSDQIVAGNAPNSARAHFGKWSRVPRSKVKAPGRYGPSPVADVLCLEGNPHAPVAQLAELEAREIEVDGAGLRPLHQALPFPGQRHPSAS
jgi:hypothetical protein